MLGTQFRVRSCHSTLVVYSIYHTSRRDRVCRRFWFSISSPVVVFFIGVYFIRRATKIHHRQSLRETWRQIHEHTSTVASIQVVADGHAMTPQFQDVFEGDATPFRATLAQSKRDDTDDCTFSNMPELNGLLHHRLCGDQPYTHSEADGSERKSVLISKVDKAAARMQLLEQVVDVYVLLPCLSEHDDDELDKAGLALVHAGCTEFGLVKTNGSESDNNGAPGLYMLAQPGADDSSSWRVCTRVHEATGIRPALEVGFRCWKTTLSGPDDSVVLSLPRKLHDEMVVLEDPGIVRSQLKLLLCSLTAADDEEQVVPTPSEMDEIMYDLDLQRRHATWYQRTRAIFSGRTSLDCLRDDLPVPCSVIEALWLRQHLRQNQYQWAQALVFLLHPMVSATVFQALHCRALGDGELYLAVDLGVKCTSAAPFLNGIAGEGAQLRTAFRVIFPGYIDSWPRTPGGVFRCLATESRQLRGRRHNMKCDHLLITHLLASVVIPSGYSMTIALAAQARCFISSSFAAYWSTRLGSRCCR